MRLLISTQTFYPGTNGQASFTIRLAEGLAQLGHTLAVFTPATLPRDALRLVHGVRVYETAAWHLGRIHPEIYLPVHLAARLRRAFDDFAPDLVHVQDHYPLSAQVAGLARRRRVPVIGTNHFLPENILPNIFPALTLRRSLRPMLTRVLWGWMLRVYNQLAHITTPTETAAAILRRQAVRVPVTAISCGVDVQRFRPLPRAGRAATLARYGVPAAATVFLYVGRLDSEKRVDVLLRALAQLPASRAHAVISGRGGQEAALRRLANELGVADRVTFTGYLPPEALPLLLNAADCFVMPSPQELQSIATIEAMATGRPILAAQARALPELVAHDVNGFLFEPDCVDSAAGWMRTFVASPGRWEAMGVASLERARRHSLVRTLHAYEAVYHAALAAHQSAEKPAYGYSVDTL